MSSWVERQVLNEIAEQVRLREAAEARADELQRERDELEERRDRWVHEAVTNKDAERQARREADQLRAALIGAQFCLVVEYNRYRDSKPTDPGEIVGREEGMEILGETLNEIAALIGPYYAGKVAAVAGVQADNKDSA